MGKATYKSNASYLDSTKISIQSDVTPAFLDDLADVDPAKLAAEFVRMRSETKGGRRFRTLCHGDFHIWNTAFDAEGGDLALFDYQVRGSQT